MNSTDFPKIPRIEIISLLGEGGMGCVFKARQLDMDRLVAVKVLSRLTDEHAILRFKKEAQNTSNLEHPNIVKIISFGVSEKQEPYLVMEYLEGSSLADELRTTGRFSFERFRDVFLPVLSALDKAHQAKIVHRDIKPGNIMICSGPGGKAIPKLVDFGIAKVFGQELSQNLTKSGALLGSPLYMSPEQCQGQQLDGRSDIYSLACVMHESLCGEPPFAGDSSFEVMQKHCLHAPPTVSDLSRKIDIKRELAQVTLRGLAKDPTARPQTAAEFAQQLKSVLEKITLDKVPQLKNSKPNNNKNKILVFGSVTGVALILVAAALFSQRTSKPAIPKSNRRMQFTEVLSEAKREYARGSWKEAELDYQKSIETAYAEGKPVVSDDALMDALHGLSLSLEKQNRCLNYVQLQTLMKLRPQNSRKKLFLVLASNGTRIRQEEANAELAIQLHEKALEQARETSVPDMIKRLAMNKELAMDYALAGKIAEAKTIVQGISGLRKSENETIAALATLSEAQALVAISLVTNNRADIKAAKDSVDVAQKVVPEDGPQRDVQTQLKMWYEGKPVSLLPLRHKRSN